MEYRDVHIYENDLIAKLQIEIFNDFFMAGLGLNILKTYYKAILKYPETICIVAEKDDGKAVGFVLGQAKAGLKPVIRRYPLIFCLIGIKLLLFRPCSILRLLNNIEKIDQNQKDFIDKQDYSEIGLIGVINDHQGERIGQVLLFEFEKRVKQRGAKKLSLTTDYFNNEKTLNAYSNWGFNVYYEFMTYPDRRMYRLIKDIQ